MLGKRFGSVKLWRRHFRELNQYYEQLRLTNEKHAAKQAAANLDSDRGEGTDPMNIGFVHPVSTDTENAPVAQR